MNKPVILLAASLLYAAPVLAIKLLAQSESKVSDQADTYFDYLSAELASALGDKDQAYRSYDRVIKRTQSSDGTRGYIRLLYADGKFAEIAQKENTFAGDKELQLIFVQAYLHTNHTVKAHELLTQLLAAHPKDEQVHYFAVMNHLRTGNQEQALTAIENFVAQATQSPRLAIFHFLKSKILLSLGKQEEALVAAKQSVALHPKFEKGWLFSGMLAEQLGNVEEAANGYRRFLDMVGSDPMVEKQLINLHFKSGNFRQAKEELRRLASDTPEYYFDVALLEWKMGDHAKALASTNQVLKRDEDFVQAKLLKVELLLALKKAPQALRLLKNWIGQEPDERLPLHTLLLLRRTGISGQLLIETLESIGAPQRNKQLLAALADLYTIVGNTAKATSLCSDMLELVTNPLLRSQLQTKLGQLYFASGQHKRAEQVLIAATQELQVHPSAYNLLAYVYATVGRKLDIAIELADKALKSFPKSAVYLDTKGYVLYKLGEKQEAHDFFTQALAVAPKDKTIQTHLSYVTQ